MKGVRIWTQDLLVLSQLLYLSAMAPIFNQYLRLRITGPLYWRLSVSKTHVNELLSGVQKWMENIGMN